MSVFSAKELEYMAGQRLGRLATVDFAGNPHVVPVGFRYNPQTDTIDIGGRNIAGSLKWGHAKRHPRVSFAVDDVLPPWRPRSILIQADAELLQDGGQNMVSGFAPEFMRLHPIRITSMGIDGEGRERSSRTVPTS